MPEPGAESPRLLVIRRRYLGDIVLLGSVVRNLRLHWPAAHITFLTEAAYAGVVPLNPEIDAALTFPGRATGWLSFVRQLRRGHFTHVLDFDNTEKTALVTRLTGAAVRVTFDRELIAHRYGRLYTHTAKVTNAFYDSHPITDTYLALPAAIGVPIVSREIHLVPRPADVATAVKLTGGPRAKNGHRAGKVLLHPGSRSAHRIWPAAHFAAVCDRLQDELGAQVFLTAGPAEQPLVEEICRAAQSHLVTVPPSPHVGAFAALAAQFDVFLCHDSGPMHIAAGVGTPVVALFGSQNATIWRPIGDQHTVLQAALPCACFPVGALPSACVKGDSYRSYCVRQLSEAVVFAAVAARLT